VTSVHQLVPSAVPGDATTAHTLQVQDALRHAGFDSEVFALAVHPALEGRVRLAHELPGPTTARHALVYQFSSFSALADLAAARRERLAVNYHNLTPARFFGRHQRAAAEAVRAAELQLERLASHSRLAICDSAFNAEDARAHGFEHVTVVPVLVDLDAFDLEPDAATMERLRRAREAAGGAPAWLFVGVVAPHKAQHELVSALALYRRLYQPGAQLWLVGRCAYPAYADALRGYVGALGLAEAVLVAGEVTQAELAAYYRSATLYLSMSRHEGFGVPLLEAMHHGLPVVARPAGAVPETVGSAGLLLGGDDPGAAAVAARRVEEDAVLRRHLVEAGRQRLLTRFSPERARRALLQAVRELLS
jgi:glycosyltransferase involved in cell wall biosynthesis